MIKKTKFTFQNWSFWHTEPYRSNPDKTVRVRIDRIHSTKQDKTCDEHFPISWAPCTTFRLRPFWKNEHFRISAQYILSLIDSRGFALLEGNTMGDPFADITESNIAQSISKYTRIFYKEVLYKEGSTRIGKHYPSTGSGIWLYQKRCLLKKDEVLLSWSFTCIKRASQWFQLVFISSRLLTPLCP